MWSDITCLTPKNEFMAHTRIHTVCASEAKKNNSLSKLNIEQSSTFFSANCIVMALDEHLPNGDKTILALQLVSISSPLKLPLHKL